MATGTEIRTQISSIKSTQKITNAMQMVAASKIRKAQLRMSQSMPYADKMRLVLSHVAKSHTEVRHPYLQVHDHVQRVGLIIVSTDRGLCGGLNTNLFRSLLKTTLKEWQDKGAEIDLCLIGSKALLTFGRSSFNVVAHTENVGEEPEIADLIGTIKVMLDAYSEGKLDKLLIAYNVYVNTMTQKPTVQQLLPLEVVEEESEATGKSRYWDYIYEPDAKKLLDTLLHRYIESQVYQAVVDNEACEQAARMVAMKSATDNAGEIIKDLQLAYNKARQAAITTEISEIVGGAAAV